MIVKIEPDLPDGSKIRKYINNETNIDFITIDFTNPIFLLST